MFTIDKKIKNIFITVLVFCGFIFLSACAQDIDKQLASIAAEANKELPLKTDDNIRLDTVTALEGKKIQYDYTITEDLKEEEIENFKVSRSRLLRSFTKNSQSLKFFREKEVTFIHRYKDINGNETAVFEYTPQDYK